METKGREFVRVNYTYFAYISYKREDERWARWLRWQLQSYRIPIATRRRYAQIPSHCKPVFMDKTNLTPGILDKGLRQEVQDSRFLIVICSRAARAESKYLDAELQFFLDSGGDLSRVIPFVVDQSDNVVEECFPRLLREICQTRENIVGANVHDDGKRMAVIKTVAAMLGLKREELESDDLRRRTRNSFLAAVLAVVLAIGLWRAWDYYWPKAFYYPDYVECYGVPEGVGAPLSPKEVSAQETQYEIITTRGKVRELRCVNSAGKLRAPEGLQHFDAAARKIYSYKNDGMLGTVEVRNEHNTLLYALSYRNRSTVDLDSNGDMDSAAAAFSLSAATTASLPGSGESENENKSNVSRNFFQYDSSGRATEVRYASDNHNHVAADADGVSGLQFQRDTLGRVTRRKYLTYTGEEDDRRRGRFCGG